MSAVLVDSNVLLDVITNDTVWGVWSSNALAAAGDVSRLLLNPVIYAEVSVRFSRIEELEEALPRELIEREPIPYEAAFLAGKAFLSYRRRSGSKTTVLPDFLIGAHAATAGHRVLTRDAARFRTYFPRLELIAPEA